MSNADAFLTWVFGDRWSELAERGFVHTKKNKAHMKYGGDPWALEATMIAFAAPSLPERE